MLEAGNVQPLSRWWLLLFWFLFWTRWNGLTFRCWNLCPWTETLSGHWEKKGFCLSQTVEALPEGWWWRG